MRVRVYGPWIRLGVMALASLLGTRVAMAVCGDGILDGDGLCNAQDGCNFAANSSLIKESQLLVSRLATPPGDDRLRFAGVLTLPVVPAIDPAANGSRVTLFSEPVNGSLSGEATVALDVLIPGGRHWTARGTGAWQYRDPAGRIGGITSVSVKLRPPIMPTTRLTNVAFLMQGRREQYVITPELVTSSIANSQFLRNALFAEVSLAAGVRDQRFPSEHALLHRVHLEQRGVAGEPEPGLLVGARPLGQQ